MENVEDVLEKLFAFYNVGNVKKLSEKMGTSQKNISNWKIRNSINAVKKKCRELEIYNEIFGKVSDNEDFKLDEDLKKILQIASPIIEDEKKKDEFILYVKKWIFNNM